MKRYLILLFYLIAGTALAQQPESEQVKIYVALSQSAAANQPDSAVRYANEGMRLAEKRNDRPGQAALLLALGYINAVHGHTELARGFYNEALGLHRQLQDPAGVARAYDRLGVLDGNTSSFDEALKYNRDSRDSSGLVETYEDMGHSLEETGANEKALSYYLRALTQYEQLKSLYFHWELNSNLPFFFKLDMTACVASV